MPNIDYSFWSIRTGTQGGYAAAYSDNGEYPAAYIIASRRAEVARRAGASADTELMVSSALLIAENQLNRYRTNVASLYSGAPLPLRSAPEPVMLYPGAMVVNASEVVGLEFKLASALMEVALLKAELSRTPTSEPVDDEKRIGW